MIVGDRVFFSSLDGHDLVADVVRTYPGGEVDLQALNRGAAGLTFHHRVRSGKHGEPDTYHPHHGEKESK